MHGIVIYPGVVIWFFDNHNDLIVALQGIGRHLKPSITLPGNPGINRFLPTVFAIS